MKYILLIAGTVLIRDVNNLEEEFKIPSDEYFNRALEGKPVSIDRSDEKNTFMIKKLIIILIHTCM